MIINWGTNYATLGTLGHVNCPACGGGGPEMAVVQYSYFGLFWLFCLVYSRSYMRVCGRCKGGREVSKESLGLVGEKDSIPFMKKYGLLVLVAALIFVGLTSK